MKFTSHDERFELQSQERENGDDYSENQARRQGNYRA